MSRILIWKQTAPGCEYDIFTPTDYSSLYSHVQTRWNGVCKNWGNRLWFQGIYSAIDIGENEYDFITDEIDIDRINSSYDLILLPMANIFFHGFLDSMRLLTEIFEKIRIPTYVVVCGVQADSYDDLDCVIDSIGRDSARFIRAIYNTGGEFALRGYFTKEFFRRLGFSSAVVTGCPSLYQFGPDFQIGTKKVAPEKLNPVFNGHVKSVEKLMKAYPNSVFVDQDEYFRPLYQPDYLGECGLKFQLDFLNSYGKEAAKFLGEGRILMIADMNDWWNYLQDQDFNYSFGSRIHGTIMSILSGIPSTIVTQDSRTREMAEFFEIPSVLSDKKHSYAQEEMLVAYQEMDYTAFNAGYRHRFETYEKFLVNHGIVSEVNTNNKFFARGGDRSFELMVNGKKETFAEYYEVLNRNETILYSLQLLQKVKRRIF